MANSPKSTEIALSTVLALDLPDEEHALKVAQQLARALGKTIILTDANGKEIAVVRWGTLDS